MYSKWSVSQLQCSSRFLLFLSSGQTQTNSTQTPLICPEMYSGLLRLSLSPLFSLSLFLFCPFKVQMNRAVMGTSLVQLHPPVLFPIFLSLCWEGDRKSKTLTRRTKRWLAVLLNYVKMHTHARAYISAKLVSVDQTRIELLIWEFCSV